MAPHILSQILMQSVVVLFTLVSLAMASPAVPQAAPGSAHVRSKRHLLQMCELIAYHTNRGCLDYNNYGCYCGLGNAASRPMDDADECCKIHDQCYGQVSCVWLFPQMVGYDVTCDEDGCRCEDSPTVSSCERTTCQCDLEFGQCLGQASYNHQHSDFDRRECNRPRRRQERRDRRRRRRRRDVVVASFLDNIVGGV